MIRSEGAFTGAGGLRIAWRAWSPETPEPAPAAQVVISHGAHEHGERYARLAERLTTAGFKAWAPDHRGHGRSDGPRGVIDRMDKAVADLGRVVEMAREDADERPVFLVGHSLGGAVALNLALNDQEKLAGLVLSAPAAADGNRPGTPLPTRTALRLVSWLRPALPVHRLPLDKISRDPAELDAYRADPLIDQEPMRARTTHELVRAQSRFRAEASNLRLPLLVLVGTADVLTPPAGGRMIVDDAASPDKELRLYDGFYHELINEPEPDRERVMGEIVDWLRARVDLVPQP